MRKFYSVWSITVIAAAAFFGLILPVGVNAQAASTWTTADPKVISLGNIETNACRLERIPIAITPITVDQTLQYESIGQGCVTDGNTIDFAVWGRYAYVKFKSDRLFHRLAVSIYDNPKLIAGTDTFFKGDYRDGQSQPTILTVYRNLPSSLSAVEHNNKGVVTMYGLDQSKSEKLIGSSANPADGWVPLRDVISYVVSSNARYVLSYVDYRYIVKTDVDTGKSTVVRELKSAWYQGFDIPIAAAISNDGRYAYVSKQEEIIDMNGCGDDTVTETQTRLVHECPSKVLETNIQNAAGYLAYTTDHEFSDDGKSLEVIASPRSRRFEQFQQMWIGIAGSPVPKTLDYLALGDSYTSGEGDVERSTDGLSYYVTDNPAEYPYSAFCHLSSRSYPYLLQQYYRIRNDRMASVACSGARVTPDYLAKPQFYYGQRQKLKNMRDADRMSIQALSVNTPKPGVTPQLEFVRKYKPKTITVMGGGNDIGFSNILLYCAAPEVTVPVVIPYTCGYAVDGSDLEAILNNSIDTQYDSTIKLIDKIKSYSPDSTIIIVDYSSFVASEGIKICSLNAASLDGYETRMINRAVERMDSMLQKAAYDEDVRFVDIQDSLKGGRLCEGSKYMSGLFNINLVNLAKGDIDPQIFHPNAKGHQQIAKTIEDSEVFWKDKVNNPGSYVQKTTEGSTYQVDMVYGGIVVKTHKFTEIHLGSNTLASGSKVLVSNYSEKTELGTYDASNDGSVNTLIDTSKLPLGRHVLVLTGTSPSGESLTLYQFITVEANSVDADADGIIDKNDSCLFINHWYDEYTNKDICSMLVNPAQKANNDTASSLPSTSSADSTDEGTALPNSKYSAEPGSGSKRVLSASAQAPNKDRGNVYSWWIGLTAVLLLGGVCIYATNKHE